MSVLPPTTHLPALSAAERFYRADTDTRIAMLWMMAKRLHQASTVAAPAAAFSQVVQGLIRQLHQVQREDQLDVLRDMVTGANTRLAEVYGTLDTNMRLAFWYRLVNSHARGVMADPLKALAEGASLHQTLAELDRHDSNELVNLFKTAVSATGVA
jgi:hypothetical protein